MYCTDTSKPLMLAGKQVDGSESSDGSLPCQRGGGIHSLAHLSRCFARVFELYLDTYLPYA